MPKIIPKTDSRLLNDWRSNVSSDNIKSTVPKRVDSVPAPASLIRKKLFKSIDEKYRLANPTVGDQVSDIGTKISSGLKTLGGSVVGDAIKSISPDAANTVSKYTAGMISPTSDEDIKVGRLGSALDKVNLVSQGATGVMLGELGAGAMNYAGGKIAGKIAGEAIQNNATTDIINRVAKTKYEIPTSSKDIIKKGNSGRPLHQYELDLMNNEIEKNGVLDIQKGFHSPIKKMFNETITPYGYGSELGKIGTRKDDLFGYVLNKKNPRYTPMSEYVSKKVNNDIEYFKNRKGINLSKDYGSAKPTEEELIVKYTNQYKRLGAERSEPKYRAAIKKINIEKRNDEAADLLNNRYSAYDAYQGIKPKRNIYGVSDLSTNKEVTYSVKDNAIDKDELARVATDITRTIRNHIKDPRSSINDDGVNMVKKISDDEYVVGGLVDGFTGTMGGYSMGVKRLKNGNLEFKAIDDWDIHPFRKLASAKSKNIENSKIPTIIKKPSIKIIKKAGDIEAYSSLGIGKPLKVRARMEVDTNGNLIKSY